MNGEPFVCVEGMDFRVSDWIRDKQLIDAPGPCVVVNVFDDMTERFVIIRDAFLRHEMMPLTEFIQRVKLERYEKIVKPGFLLGQVFKNKFTEETIEIKDVPHNENDEEQEYVYYVYAFTPTFGYNYKCMKESDIQKFYIKEGVFEV